MSDRLLVWAAIGSIAGHVVVGRLLEELPERTRSTPPPRPVEVRIVEPPPPPPPPPPRQPEPPPPEPVKQVYERPRTKPIAAVARAETPRDTKPVEVDATATGTSTTPVFGVAMSSTSQGGSVAVPVGNTSRPTSPGTTGDPRPLAAPVAAFEVTKMPIPQGRCTGTYTEAARKAALEGAVVLDLIVDEHGRARDIKVISGLGHGLTEAAIAALQACRFSPGERNATPVAVRVRGFKIRFVLQDGG